MLDGEPNRALPQPSVDGCDVAPGDAVKIREAILADKSRQTRMTPKELWKLGHPNLFLVRHVFAHKGIVCVRLVECCGRFEVPKERPSRAVLCDGHPIEWFEKTEYVPGPDDRFLNILTPFGPLLEFAYIARERNPGLFAKLCGREDWKFSLLGELTKLVAKPLQDRGYL